MAHQTIRIQDCGNEQTDTLATAVERIYNDLVDVVIVRDAFPRAPLEAVGKALDADANGVAWARPNQVNPADDIDILGTETPATPTYRAPRGASLDEYLKSAGAHASLTSGLYGSDFQPEQQIESLLGKLSGDRPVGVPVSADRRNYVPYTLRRLRDGRGISIHHDYHYKLSLYTDLAPRLDTTTLVSFFVTLQQPTSGGELVVYTLRADDPNQPRLPSGQWDSAAIEKEFSSSKFDLHPGDLILLASGRQFHRVQRVVGPQSRVTLGGFLAFDKDRSRVYYWS